MIVFQAACHIISISVGRVSKRVVSFLRGFGIVSEPGGIVSERVGIIFTRVNMVSTDDVLI